MCGLRKDVQDWQGEERGGADFATFWPRYVAGLCHLCDREVFVSVGDMFLEPDTYLYCVSIGIFI